MGRSNSSESRCEVERDDTFRTWVRPPRPTRPLGAQNNGRATPGDLGNSRPKL